MKLTKQLELIFADSAQRNFVVRVNNPRADVTETEIKQRMDRILAANVFRSNYGALVASLGARLVTREVTEYDLQD